MLKVILIATVLRLVAAEALCPERCSCNPQTHIKCTNVSLDRVLENITGDAQHMIISFSDISSLNTTPMKKLNKLTNVTMNYKSVKLVGPSVFNFTNNLTYLDLSSNDIESLHHEALTRLNELRILILKNNKISFINPQLFLHNTKLIFLDLSHNVIESIHASTFDKNIHLCWVNLEGNPLILPSDWYLLFKVSLNTLEVSVNDSEWIIVSLANIPSLKVLTDGAHEEARVKRTASNSGVKINMKNFSSYENDSFLSKSERITLNDNLLNKMGKMWNTKYGSLSYNRDRQVVRGSRVMDNPLFIYCVHWSVWFWLSDRMTTYTQSTRSWKLCEILHSNSISNPPPSTMLQSKIWELTSPTSDTTEVPTVTSTLAYVAEVSHLCITEQPSLVEDNRNFTSIILYISIPACVIIIVVIVTVIIIKKAKRSREELGTSHADQYFYFFNAFPRSQASEISKN